MEHWDIGRERTGHDAEDITHEIGLARCSPLLAEAGCKSTGLRGTGSCGGHRREIKGDERSLGLNQVHEEESNRGLSPVPVRLRPCCCCCFVAKFHSVGLRLEGVCTVLGGYKQRC